MINNQNQFMSSKYDELLSEANHLRDLLKAQSQRLAASEDIIRYYANPNNYILTQPEVGSKSVWQNVMYDDLSESDNQAQTKIAGRRARSYLAFYESD